MGPGNEAMVGTQIQKIHQNKARKERKTHGKNPPLKVQCIKKKNEKEQKVVAKQPCPSLKEDLASVQVCARWRFCWRCRCLHGSNEIDAPLRCPHISTFSSCNDEDSNKVWIKFGWNFGSHEVVSGKNNEILLILNDHNFTFRTLFQTIVFWNLIFLREEFKFEIWYFYKRNSNIQFFLQMFLRKY